MKSDELFLFLNCNEIMSFLKRFTNFLTDKAEVFVGLNQGTSHYLVPGMVITKIYSVLNNKIINNCVNLHIY